MQSPLISVLILVLGIALGVGIGLGIWTIIGASKKQQQALNPEIPTAAIEILDNLDRPGLLFNLALNPVHINHAAKADVTAVNHLPLADTDFMAAIRGVLDTGVPFKYKPETAEQENIQITAFRVADSFVAVLIHDLGEEQRLNAMRRDFIANVSHEFKTPIAAISLLAEAISQASNDPQIVKNFSEKLLKESQRLGDLSRDIIHLSRAQSDLTPTQRVRVKLGKLIKSANKRHKNLAEQRQVTVISKGLETELPDIFGDPEALEIAYSNILSNAIRFSPEGGKVGVGVAVTDSEIKITVTDQGPGIPAQEQNRIFERFYRADASRNRASGGTGLGLSIAKHTMLAHGGRINLWSETGHGSTFTMVLPVHTDLDVARKKAKTKAKKRLKKTKKQVEASK